MRFAIFRLHLSKLLRLPRKSDATQNHLSKPKDLTLQNATPLRKSAPGPPNSSDEHVSCIAPATENASLQILFKCPTPAIVFVVGWANLLIFKIFQSSEATISILLLIPGHKCL